MDQTKNHSYNAFKKLGYPSKKLENWKFSNSSHLKNYNIINQDRSEIDIKQYLAISDNISKDLTMIPARGPQTVCVCNLCGAILNEK